MSDEPLAGGTGDHQSRSGEWPLSAAEYYAEMLQLPGPDEGAPHHGRVREDIVPATAQGSG